MTHPKHDHGHATSARRNARAAQFPALKPLALALTEGAICHPACPHLWSTFEGDPRCGAFVAALHPAADEDPPLIAPAAERCTDCVVAEDLFARRAGK